MSMKKKKTPQIKTEKIPAELLKGSVPVKRSEPVPRNPPRPALGEIGRSLSALLDRTKVLFRAAEKADSREINRIE
jgi:hypothetical protein